MRVRGDGLEQKLIGWCVCCVQEEFGEDCDEDHERQMFFLSFSEM